MSQEDLLNREAPDPLIGQIIAGKHKVLSILGRGGMGNVYLADDLDLGRQVALKVLSGDMASNAKIVERFKREARAAASISHRNVVQIFEIGQLADGQPYLVMEVLEGQDLKEELVRLKRLPVHRTVDIVGQVLFALSAAHAKGVVHRDLKPGNIYLSEETSSEWQERGVSSDRGSDRVKLFDFGISRFIEAPPDLPDLTACGMLIGTPAYMAPEQITKPQSVDGRADIYAVGVILFLCLTGRLPYVADNVHSLVHMKLTDPSPKIKEYCPVLPGGLAFAIERAMEKDANLRFQSAEEFIEALRPFHDGGVRHDSWSSLDLDSAPQYNDAEIADTTPITMEPTQPPFDQAASTGVLAGEGEDYATTIEQSNVTPGPWPVRDTTAHPEPSKRRPLVPVLVAGGLTVVASVILAALLIQRWQEEPESVPYTPSVAAVASPAEEAETQAIAGQPTDSEPLDTVSLESPPESWSIESRDTRSEGYPGGDSALLTDGASPLDGGVSAVEPRIEDPEPNTNGKLLSEARNCHSRRDYRCCIERLSKAERTPSVAKLFQSCRVRLDRQRRAREEPATQAPSSQPGEAPNNATPHADVESVLVRETPF